MTRVANAALVYLKAMKRLSILLFALTCISTSISAQVYAKLNALYAAVGVINPHIEAAVSPHSSMVVDLTYSPWRSINDRHLNFGILQGEYRYYFRQATKGWYVSANLSMMGFDLSKPQIFKDSIISLNKGYSKGFGLMCGVGAGYEHHFAKRWVVDIYVAFDYMHSWYNGYTETGEIIMTPHGHEKYERPDPFNVSAEWLPAKVGVAIGYQLFKPKR